MATAGSRDKNPFRPGGELGKTSYYLLVDTDGPNKGRITIKTPTLQGNISGSDGDRTVGFIPLDNTFQPSTTTNPEEIKYFSSASGQKSVKNQGVITVQKSGVPENQARQLIFPNTATSTDGPSDSPDPDSTPATVPAYISNEVINNTINTIKSDPSEKTIKDNLASINVRYPETIDTNQDTILFRLKEIIGRSFTDTKNLDTNFSFGSKSLSETFGSVVLPIQPSISDSNGVDWGGANLDPLSAYAGRASLTLATSSDITQKIGEELKQAAGLFKSNYQDYAKAINLYLAQEAIGAQGLFSRATGSILNPNLELLFNGPTLRPFNFTFRLSPRSKKEAEIVKKIIYFFKAGMSIRRANTGVFLKAPYVFSIQYQTGYSDKKLPEHKSLNKIKDCALLGCDVDYTPDGTYMTFNDEEKTITSYQLTLRFTELDPIYNTDYADGHPIGY